LRRVGLLGTPSTIRASIYQDAFNKEGIETLVPSESNFLNIEKAIRNVISESTTREDRQTLKEIADYLKRGGAEAIVLGCTELPLIFPQKYSLPVYNSVEILSLALLRKYYQ
jgi:aspartate racemase